jgi:hypothetical protein
MAGSDGFLNRRLVDVVVPSDRLYEGPDVLRAEVHEQVDVVRRPRLTVDRARQ